MSMILISTSDKDIKRKLQIHAINIDVNLKTNKQNLAD